MQAGQGSAARHEALIHSYAYDRMRRMRAEVGRNRLMQPAQLDDGNWHLLCARRDCRASIAMLTDGVAGRTYTLSELLSTAVAHYVEHHGLDVEFDGNGEDYA